MAQTTLADRLRALFPESSGRSRNTWLAHGRVLVDGRVVRDGRTVVHAGERVALGPETVPRVPLPRPLRLVHDDEHVLVVEKPPDLLTIATESQRGRTVYRMVWDYLAAARPPRRPFIVHRLDRETSGLLVLAKSPAAKSHLQAQFASHAAERRYVAIVEGRVAADAGTIESRIIQDRALRVRVARRDEEGGRSAVTRYRVRERRTVVTVLDLALGTGRRRQIRVQLAALGHPVVGDGAHGATTDPLRRLCLHATALGFVHPGTGKPVRFESPIPAAFARLDRRSPMGRGPRT
jgi:23S rRNA pseudouridine1911/1915/1917 synthase